MTACWDEDTNLMQRAYGWKDDITQSLEQVETELNDIHQHPISTTKKIGFRKYMELSQRRKKLTAQLDMLEDTFPPKAKLVKGPNNISYLKKGVIAVKRYQNTKEVFPWIGTFNINKVSQGSIE